MSVGRVKTDFLLGKAREELLGRVLSAKANEGEREVTAQFVSGANFSGSNLGIADFSEANPSGAKLHRVKLIRANLNEINLRGA
jgi:uncharacterized protein YjbI with pentapeptide repeats